jgi:hypothetical protein
METHAFGSHEPPPPPLLDELLLPEPLLSPPPPAHHTGDHSAGTADGVHPGSLVCAWMHWYVVPSYVTSWPAEYATHVAHGVAAAHCAALTAEPVDSAPSPGADPHATTDAMTPTAANEEREEREKRMFRFIRRRWERRALAAQKSAWISSDPARTMVARRRTTRVAGG